MATQRSRLAGILVLALVALGLLFAFALGACAQLRRDLYQTQHWVVHTHQVSECIRDLTISLSASDSTLPAYLQAAHGARDPRIAVSQSILGNLDKIAHLTADNPRQQRRIAELRPLIGEAVRDTLHPRDATKDKREALLYRRVDAILDGMQNEETWLLQRRDAAADRAIRSTQATITRALWFVISILAVCIATAVLHLQQRTRAERELHVVNDALRQEREGLGAVTAFLSEVVKARFDVSEIMALVTGRTQELTGATGAAIELLDGDALVYRTTTGDLAKSVGTRLALETSFSGRCVLTGEILYTADCENDDRVDRSLAKDLGIRSMVAVPLVLEGKNAGVLKVSSSQPNAFDDHTMEILGLMGGVIATAMTRAAQFQANEAVLLERTQALKSLEEAQAELKMQLTTVEDLNVVLQYQSAELQRANTQLEALATTDGLTGLKNHRAFQERLKEECMRATRYQTPLSVVLIDVDKFKLFNDTFGHPAGDAVLNKVARILEDVTRECDMVARYGGEEFVFVLPQTDRDSAYIVAERCRARIEAALWDLRPVTASFGVAAVVDGVNDPADVVARADAALYVAKSGGRNRVALDGASILSQAA